MRCRVLCDKMLRLMLYSYMIRLIRAEMIHQLIHIVLLQQEIFSISLYLNIVLNEIYTTSHL